MSNDQDPSNENIVNPDSSVENSTSAPSEVISPTEPAESSPASTEPTSTSAANAVPATPVPPAAVSPAETSPGNKKKKLVLLAGAVAILVVLLAGGAAAYFSYYLPAQPEKIAQDALTNSLNSEKLKSSKFEGVVELSGGEASRYVSGVTFEGSAGGDARAFDAKVSFNTAVTKITLDLRSTDGKSLFMRLSGLDGLDKLLAASAAGSNSLESAMISQYSPMIAKVNNQWFSIDQSLLSQSSGGIGASALTAEGNLSEEDAKKVGEIYKRNQFLTVNKKLADETIHNMPSYHLQATIDSVKLKAFLQEVKNANIKALGLDQKDIDSIGGFNFGNSPFDMWISKKDRVLTQLATSLEESGTTYKIRVALFDFNQPVNIEKPGDAKSILQLLGDMAPEMSGANAEINSPLMGL